MTKAKTAKPAAGGKKTEPAPKREKKADVKAKPAKMEKGDGKASGKAKAVKKVDKDKIQAPPPVIEAEVSGDPAPDARKPAPTFLNSGVGVKVSSKKPGLSVAPGAMIRGRPAQVKTDRNPRPSDRRLSKKELQEIKSFLLERRERLLAGMRRELAMQKERAESKVADEVDKATDAYDEDLSFEIAVANDQELEEIQVALEKIERGTYGECEVCGCGISPSRLKILPSATTCVSCRGQEEMARRRDDGSATAFSILTGEEAEADAEVM